MISVIIPVFNSGPYLRQCLDSVLGQTLTSIEVICVDDASSDGSRAVLEEYAGKDRRVRILTHDRNQGAARSRNEALDLAEGEHISFVDSDDWIDPDFLERMYNEAVSSGMGVVTNYNWFFESEDEKWREQYTCPHYVDKDVGLYPTSLVVGSFYPVLWCRLYKSSFLRDNDIRFPDIKCAEDNYFTALSEAVQGESYIFAGPFYHYRCRKSSLSRGSESEITYYHLLNFLELAIALKERGIPPSSCKRFYIPEPYWDLRSDKCFNLAKKLFEMVVSDVREAPELYSNSECYSMMAVLSCETSRKFRIRFFPNMLWSYRLRKVWNMRIPKKTEILDGSWKI